MAEKELPTPEEMQEMAEIDIRMVDTSSLVDIEQVQIQTELPQEERIADYIRQINRMERNLKRMKKGIAVSQKLC